MADGRPGFGAGEYRRRWAALQARMAEAGEDALLLTGPADVFYLTGFLTRFWESPARPWYIVLPAKGDPVAVIPEIGTHLMGQCHVGEVRTWPAPDPVDDGIGILTETLAALVPERGRIGLPMGLETSLRMPLADYRRLTAALAPVPFPMPPIRCSASERSSPNWKSPPSARPVPSLRAPLTPCPQSSPPSAIWMRFSGASRAPCWRPGPTGSVTRRAVPVRAAMAT
ncbi:hypothetical protein KU6B_33910 [Mameliella alba]|nr:hypothetical protein KU6B_33910 [Mameliella alba]